jgi:predicted Zn-dependent peptidase
LAYYIRSSVDAYEDTGVFDIQAGLDKNKIEPAIELIVSELKKMTSGVTDEELSRAKEYLFGKTALDLEDSSHLSSWYAQQELMTGKMLTPEEKHKKIMAITGDDIATVAKDIINLDRASLAIIGPFKNEAKFKKLLK